MKGLQLQRIGVIGASARSAAQSLKRAGYTPVAADLFADVDLCRIAETQRIADYPNQFSGWMKEQSLDAWIYTGALENYPELVDELAQIVPLWGISGQLLRDLRDPNWLVKQCDQHGISFPETSVAKNQREGSWLAKSYRHSSGLGIHELATESNWQEAERNGWYAQERVDGKSCSATFMIEEQMVWLLGFAWHLPCSGNQYGFRGAVMATGSQHQHEILGSIGDWLYTVGARGVVGVDLVDTGKELWLLEVNPRYTATVEICELNYGISCYDSSRFQGYESNSHHWGKLIYYAKQQVVITKELHSWIESLGDDFQCADIPHCEEVIEESQPVITLLARVSKTDSSPVTFQTTIDPCISQLEELLCGES